MTAPFASLADAQRYVAWRNEKRGDKPTKVPYGAGRRRAKADDPATWLTRAQAEETAQRIVNGQGGGIGIMLGDLGADLYLAGFDLDSCNEDGTLAPWAAAILDLIDTYAEISPSGNGIKAFCTIERPAVRPFLDRLGVPADGWGCRRGIPGHDSKDHGPAIECYCNRRYFTITEHRWPGAPDTIRTLDGTTLDRLADLIPSPAQATKSAPGGGNKRQGGDTSRSGIAFNKVLDWRRAGTINTFEEMCEALRADPDTAAWCREKGAAAGGRELRRIWHKTAPDDEALPKIAVRAGLRHEAADAGLAALDAAGTAFYQRGERIVRAEPSAAKTADGSEILTPGIVEVGQAALGRALGQAARWEAFNREGDRVRIDPPGPVVKQIAEMAGEWPFPLLAGVIGTPTLRPDGSLLLDEGYDAATGLVLLGPPAMPVIPPHPSRADAERALAVLESLLGEFPFKDADKGNLSIDRAVALSQLLTPVLRGGMPTAPMHLANAPQPGTGKSYLADRDYQEFRAEVGHDRRKGAQPCRDARNRLYLTLCSTSCWPGLIPRRPLIPMA